MQRIDISPRHRLDGPIALTAKCREKASPVTLGRIGGELSSPPMCIARTATYSVGRSDYEAWRLSGGSIMPGACGMLLLQLSALSRQESGHHGILCCVRSVPVKTVSAGCSASRLYCKTERHVATPSTAALERIHPFPAVSVADLTIYERAPRSLS